MGFFSNGATTSTPEESLIQKSLSAGYGLNPLQMEGGRAIIPESLETTLTNVLSETDSDCKMFGTLHTQPVKSTVHEIAVRTGYGNHRFNTIPEGGIPLEDNQALKRKVFDTKYIATLGKVTKQMEVVETLEGAYESEKIAAVNRVALTAEHLIFHGDSSVIPTEFDGLEKQIRDAETESTDELKRSTVVDLHGLEIGEKVSSMPTGFIADAGEAMFDDITMEVYRKGGDLKRALYAPILAKQFKRLYNDRMRVLPNSNTFTFEQLPDIPTAIGSTLRIKGKDAGADKLYHVKGRVFADGNVEKRPFAPTSVTVQAKASNSNSRFLDSDAGVYKYSVHAINHAGISAGTDASSTVTVATGGSVTITITPATNGAVATGYVITRTAPNGSILMEMVSIPANVGSTTVFEDVNRYLPGTATCVLLSDVESKGHTAISFGQLMPLSSIPIALEADLTRRFVVSLYGMLEVRNPEQQALIENIGYAGGLY